MEIERRYCSTCMFNQKADKFEEGFKTCNICRAKNKRHYHNNPEKYREYRREDRKNNPEKYQERQREYMKEYKTRMHCCSLCDVEVQLKSKARHEKTAWHQGNLRRSENPEEKLPEPDEIKIIDGKKHVRCLTCRASFLPYQWEKHIMEKHRET